VESLILTSGHAVFLPAKDMNSNASASLHFGLQTRKNTFPFGYWAWKLLCCQVLRIREWKQQNKIQVCKIRLCMKYNYFNKGGL